MMIGSNFPLVSFVAVLISLYGILHAQESVAKQASSGKDTRNESKHSRTGESTTSLQAVTGETLGAELPDIIVKENPSQKSSFLLPSLKKEEKPFSPIKRRKAIRSKVNEVYSKENIVHKAKDNKLGISYLPDRSRASITRSMHQIVVEKEQGLKPKIEYKSVKYTMRPEESGNEIQTSMDHLMKEKGFHPSVSQFLIKRKYLIGSLNGKDKDKKGFQYILDGQTVFNDKYITSTADPIGFKQKSDQKSINKLEEVKLLKESSSKKNYYKSFDSNKLSKEGENKSVYRKEKIQITKSKEKTKDTQANSSPITKYDKMSMRDKLMYSQRFNEKKPPNTNKEAEKVFDKVSVESKTSKIKNETEKYVTRRKTIRPKQEKIKTNDLSGNIPLAIEVDTKDWKTNYQYKKKKLLSSVMEPTGEVHIISKGKKSKELKVSEVNKGENIINLKRKLYESQPLNIEIDTKDWKTNYRKKKNKLLRSMLDSNTFKQQQDQKGDNTINTIKEVVQQRRVHSYRIKPNTVIEVGNTEITVGVPSHVALKSQTIDRKMIEQNPLKEKTKAFKPPATYKAFRSDEMRKEFNTATVSNTDKTKKVTLMTTTTSVLPTISLKRKTEMLPPKTTTQFPLKIEFVTAKMPVDGGTSKNKSKFVTEETIHKKFITNGLSEDSKKSRIITSSENLNVNLDHYADFTRTGITNGENNIVVGTLSGIKDRANAGMLNLNVDTAERVPTKNITETPKTKQKELFSAKVTTNGSKVKPVTYPDVNTNTKSLTEARLSNVKKKGKSMTDFSISLLAAHEEEKRTQGSVQKRQPSTRAPVRKAPRFVIRTNKNNGKSFVFSFKTNKKPTLNIPKVPNVQFQPAFIYKDTAESHRSENSLYVNSIHDKPEKTPNTFYKYNAMREKHKDFRWPVPSSDRVQGIPVTQPPPDVSTLGMIISGDFVSSFAEQAFKDLNSLDKSQKQKNTNYSGKSKLRQNKLVKNDFLFPMQSLYTPSPKAITTVDLAIATKRRNGLYENDNFYSSDIHNQIKQLLNSTETVQLTDIPGNIDIQTSTVPLPKLRNTFTRNQGNNIQFVYTAETQQGRTRMQKITKPRVQLSFERSTSGNGVPASITGYDLGLSLKRDKHKNMFTQMTQATRTFEQASQSPIKNVYSEIKSLSNLRKKDIPSKIVDNIVLPIVEVVISAPYKPSIPKTTKTRTTTTTTTTTMTPVTHQPTTSSTKSTTEKVTTQPTKATTTTTIKTTRATTTTSSPTSTTTTTLAPTKAIISSINDVVGKAKDTLARLNEVYRGPPDNIIAVSKTDAFQKYKKAATEVIELKKSPTMVPAVGIIKPLRKSEAIYKFSQYGSKQKQDMGEENAIKREIKKLLIQQNTVYPVANQNGPVSFARVTPSMDQYMYAQNDMTSNGRDILYNTPEMTSMMIATESMLPEQNNPYIQNFNFPGANRQALGNSARYPYQTMVRPTSATPIVQPKVCEILIRYTMINYFSVHLNSSI